MAQTGIADVPPIALSRDDLIRRVLFTLGALAVVRALSFIPLPGINPIPFQEMLAFSGGVSAYRPGSVERLSLAGLGLTPYISALLVTYVIMWAFPGIKARAESGPRGLRDVNQIARVITLAFAMIQGYFVARGLEQIRSPRGHALVAMEPTLFRVSVVLTMAAGTLLIMRIGEEISARGLGNGIWVIVAAGMVGNVFQDVATLIDGLRKGSISVQHMVLLAVILLALVALVVLVERARRTVTLTAASGRREADGAISLPVNAAGFLPLYFGTAFIYLPIFVLYVLASLDNSFFGVDKLLAKAVAILGPGSWLHYVLLTLLVGLFTLVFVAMHANTETMARDLATRGRTISEAPASMPARQWIDGVVLRLACLAALYLVLVTVAVNYAQLYLPLPVPIYGFGVLLTVSVAMAIIEQGRGDVGQSGNGGS